MTLKDKTALFFNTLLEEIDSIDNEQIKERALAGVYSIVVQNLQYVKVQMKQESFDKLNKDVTNG